MSNDIFTRIRDYFQDIANTLADEKSASRIFLNPGDKGASREDILMNFLIRHLPKRCEVVRGGFIFDSSGNESRQIDLIITNDLALQFKQFEKSFNCIEGCYCAVSVKTNLDKKELTDSLDNFASIPPMPPLGVNPLLKNTQLLQGLPYCVIFAYTGIECAQVLSHIQDYYVVNKSIPQNRRPTLVVVNNTYFIVQVGPEGGKTRNGTEVPPYTFFPSGMNVKQEGGYALMYLLTEIQKAANFGSQILMNFSPYIDRIPLEDV